MRQVVLPAESKEVAARLAAAGRLIAPDPTEVTTLLSGFNNLAPWAGMVSAAVQTDRQDWFQAIAAYQRIIYDDGDTVVPCEDSAIATPTLRSLAARWLCHSRIAQAPPWALTLYRKRIHNLAEALFRDGLDNGNATAWVRLVNDHFCSQQTEAVLESLGDRAFEQGDFARARHWWAPLADLPSQETRSDRLRYPAAEAKQIRTQAKQILAVAFQGDPASAYKELKLFEKHHGQITGTLAGKKGPLVTIVGEVLDQLEKSTPVADEGWHSFGHDSSRNGRTVSAPTPRLWADGPSWRVFLEKGNKAETPEGSSEHAVSQPARRLCFHPVIAGSRVLVANARSVTGYDLFTGRRLFRYHLKDPAHDEGPQEPIERLPVEPDRSNTLTVSGDRIYARLGGQQVSPGKAAKSEASHLVCLEAIPTGDRANPSAAVREQWAISAPSPDGNAAVFEGSPVVDRNRVYIAVSRVQDRRTRTSLVCCDAASGAAHWSQEVCDAAEFEVSSKQRYRHHLLTLAGRYLVYCSHAGAILAVDAETGAPVWAVRYPSIGTEQVDGATSPRDLCPCIHAAGRLYAAPADSNRVFCLDPATGELLWERDGIEVVHLLGVAKERLFFTTPAGLRAVEAATGADQGGWMQPADGKLPPFGRGFLAGDWIFWPTQDPHFPLRVVTQDQGDQDQVERAGEPAMVFDPTQLRRLRAGNMVYANGCLVVATTEELIGYVPPAQLLPRQDKISRPASTVRRPALARPAVELFTTSANAREIGSPLSLVWKQPADNLLLPEPVVGVEAKARCVLLARDDDVICCEPDTGKPRWQQGLSFAPRWAGIHADRVLIAGDHDVEARHLADGQFLWAFRAKRDCGPFTSFQLASGRLYFLQDGRRLIALEPERGIRWSRWAPAGRVLPLDSGRFVPHFLARDDIVAIQTIRGQSLSLDAATGHVLGEGRPGSTMWPHAPLLLEPGRACVVENGSVVLRELANGRETWKFEPKWSTSSTGEPLRILGKKKNLFVVVPRNYGYEIERLDPATGRPDWSDTPRLLCRRLADLSSLSAADDALYNVADGSFICRSADDGTILWKKAVPVADGWRTLPTRDGVILYSTSQSRRWRWLPVGTILLGLPSSPLPATNTIFVFDRKTGAVQQRLDLAGGSSHNAIAVFPKTVVGVFASTAWGWTRE